MSEGIIEEGYANGVKPIMDVYWGGGVTPVTHNHPWLVKGKGFVASAKLQPGDLVRAGRQGTDAWEEEWLPIERTEDLGEKGEVFNIRVSGTHMYMVANGVGWFGAVH